MATPKKPSTTKKPATAKSTRSSSGSTRSKSSASRSSQAKQNRFGDSVLDEIILILLMVLCVFIFISLFSDSTGIVGKFTNTTLKGLLGFGAFLLPVFTIAFCLWMLISKERYFKGLKIAGGVLLLLASSALAHTLGAVTLEKSVKVLFQTGAGTNGGVLGGLIAYGLVHSVAKLGTYLILIAVLIVSVILMTGFSLFRYFAESKRRKNERIKQRAERIRQEEELREARRLEKERKEQERALKREKKKEMYNVVVKETTEETTGEKPAEEETLPENTSAFMKRIEEENLARQREELAALVRKREEEKAKQPEPEIHMPESEPDADELPVIMLRSAYEEDAASPETPEPAVTEKSEKSSGLVLNGDLSAVNTVAAPEAQRSAGQTSTTPTDNVRTLPPAGGKSGPAGNGAAERVDITIQDSVRPYAFPPLNLLGKGHDVQSPGSKTEMLGNAKKLEETLKSFGVDARVVQINKGPTVTRYELTPSVGVKVSKIVNLADDIALNLAASGIRIEAPIPGKAAVGIEVPNKEPQSVYLRDVLESDAFQKFPSKLAFALGEDIAGNPVVTDIAKMPHLLIAGATGSGKSVCINTLITSILYKAKPEEVKLLMIDPKVVELSVYNGIPHLLLPVVTDPKKAAGTLNWAVREMLQRYNDFFAYNVRDISGYNAQKKERGETDFMPQIVIIIDELADLMMAAPKEVEDSICRLAQMARAAGIHLIIATQRPSVDVITGLIKANIPSRLAFAVSSGVDSRTILDMVGAEKLLGKGDMLFYPVGMSKPVRIQGAFVTDKEVENLVEYVKGGNETVYDSKLIEQMTSAAKPGVGGDPGGDANDGNDEFFAQAMELVVTKEKASVSMLQRQFRIGFNRAARLMDELEAAGVVGPEEGSKPRKVKMTPAEYEAYKAGGRPPEEA